VRIAIVGAGAWGTALAIALARRHTVSLWARSATQREALRATRRSAYLPAAVLPDGVAVPDELAPALRAADLALLATPTAGLRAAAASLAASGAAVPAIWVCKGFEAATGELPHEVLVEVLGPSAPLAALSGPSFAAEVAQGLPTALTLAARDGALARRLARELHQQRLRVYFTDDLIGVEIGGAVKNVMAIATGISDGLGLGLNARAALITRGLAEVARLGVALGGRPETFMGLAGAGDLILTCTGDLSRNRRVGLELGRGERLGAILERLGHVAEGVHTAREADRVARTRRVDMPITRAVCAVLFEGLAPARAVEQLLARDPKAER